MNRRGKRSTQLGLSLIEILISLAIGLVILTAIGTAYVATTNTTRQREDKAQLNDPARQVMHMLKQNITNAGYVDFFDLDAASRAQAASLFIPGNSQATNLFERVPGAAPLAAPIGRFFAGLTPVFGCDGAMTTSPNAIATAGAPAAVACGAASATRHSLQIAYQGIPITPLNASNSLSVADLTTGEGLDCLQRAPAAGVMVINRFSAPAPAAGAESQMQCEGSGAAGAQPIAAGVEEFVLRYQMSAPGVSGQAAGGGQQVYLSAADVAASAQGWAGVTAVEICIVSATPASSGAAATGTADLQPTRPTCTRDANGAFDANIARAAGDRRLWKRYTSVVSVRNAVFATPL